MYITKEQLEARLKGQAEGNGISIVKSSVGAAGRGKEIPREVKVLAGALAQVDSQKNVSEALGLGKSQVSEIARGLNGSKLDEDLKSDIDKTAAPLKKDISDKALDVLLSSLNVVSEKIASSKAIDASAIAKNMAIVHDKMNPSEKGPSGGSQILIQINAPRQKSEREYEAMEVVTV